ncbi:hypothetical protein ACHAXS_011459 [Conticribra weissflogii]
MEKSLPFDDSKLMDNILVVSLYLIDSEDDILSTFLVNDVVQIHKRALLYSRLCHACNVANEILHSATLPDENDSGRETTGNTFRDNSPNHEKHHFPWSSGGDGPMFGVHCSLLNDELINEDKTLMDGDDLWQSQNGNPKSDFPLKRQKTTSHPGEYTQQPHLRAICRYGNDIADMWRCISLAIRISQTLSSQAKNMQCAIECWDVNDGHVLLIEAAEYLPSWVDDDVLQGGVGGPAGCRNRCWIVGGKVHLIPPLMHAEVGSYLISSKSVAKLTRVDALRILMRSTNHVSGNNKLITEASDAVQIAIQTRIGRTSYEKTILTSSILHQKYSTCPDLNKSDVSRHWHVAAVALPAAIARFIQQHPSLVPLLVDSFCKHAPKYLKARLSKKTQAHINSSEPSSRGNKQPETNDKHNEPITSPKLGQNFPYEKIVIIPITLTRTTYAELVTGRGCVPSFRIPNEYRSVELNKFQRQLKQLAYLEGGVRIGGNRFRRAVDIGIRLCAGLEWIIACGDDHSDNSDHALRALGDVERRLRIYWARIDSEAIQKINFVTKTTTSLSWIENAWHAGPEDNDCDKVLIHALQKMSKCLVFQPELSGHLWKEPCPMTKPGLLLRSIVKSGLNVALKWIRDNHFEDHFHMPREWEIEDDQWMEVKSLEELETEMKNLSKSTTPEDTKCIGIDKFKPRRATRRSRRKVHRSHDDPEGIKGNPDSEASADVCDNDKALTKMLDGFCAFVESEGELGGAVTNSKKLSSSNHCAETNSPEQLMTKSLNINPHRFLNTLHKMLHNEIGGSETFENETQSDVRVDAADLSKYFFEEDMGVGDISDDNVDVEDDSGNISPCDQENDLDSDPFSLKNIMVRSFF